MGPAHCKFPSALCSTQHSHHLQVMEGAAQCLWKMIYFLVTLVVTRAVNRLSWQ